MSVKKLSVKIEADISGFKKSVSEMQNSMKGATGGVSKSVSGLGGIFTKLAGTVGKIAGTVGVFKAVQAGMNLITSSVDRAISRVDTLNQFPRVLQQMGYSAEEAEKSTNRLSDGIQGLPTALDEVAGTTQRMVNVFKDVDLATESTLALNNAFLASGATQADANRGMEQYIQMLSSGKVDMQSWRTLQETMPYALQETAEAFGFTGKSAQNDFYAALQSGDITMEEFNGKMIELSEETGGFAEVALEASKGIKTSMQNIKTAIATGVANAIQAVNDWAKDNGFGEISDILDRVKAKVSELFTNVVATIPVVLDWFKNLFNTIKESTVFQTLKESIDGLLDSGKELIENFLASEHWENAKNTISDLVETFLQLDFKEIIAQVGEFFEKWSPLIAGIVAGIATFKLLFGALTGIVGIINTVIATKAALAVMAAALNTTMLPMILTIGGIALAIGALIAIGVLLYKNWDKIKAKAIELWTSLKDSWNKLRDDTTRTWNEMKDKMTSKIQEMKDNATKKFQEIKTNIENSIKGAKDAIVNRMQEAVSGALNKITEMKNNFVNKFNEIKSAANSKFEEIKSGIVNKISSTVSSVGSKFSEVYDKIMSPINRARDAVKTAVDKMKGFFNFSWKLPSIKMPSFSVKGSANPIDWIKQGVPKLSVNWYKTGGIATGASVVGIGEAGDEAIVPLSNKSRMAPFAQAVADLMPKNGSGESGKDGGDTIITGNTFHVREEADIKKIAYELKRLDDRNSRGRGRLATT